jgi:hypothetical protein
MNTALQLQTARCYDCSAALPADAQYDVCARCISAERDAYAAKQSCWQQLPERMGECVCGNHKGVR